MLDVNKLLPDDDRGPMTSDEITTEIYLAVITILDKNGVSMELMARIEDEICDAIVHEINYPSRTMVVMDRPTVQ